MTLVQQATTMMEKLPVRSQQVVVDLLKMLKNYEFFCGKGLDSHAE